jgi:hypothetical protein
MRSHRELPSSRAAKQRDELAPSQLVELHSVPCSERRMQDIKLAVIGQRVSRRQLSERSPVG